jgi:hypothetical protein
MNKKARQNSRPFPYSGATIREALAPWARPIYDRPEIRVTDPEFPVIMAAATEFHRHISACREGARSPRKKSTRVTQRQEALVKVLGSLPLKFRERPFGKKTVERLRTGIIEELGISDGDEALSEDTIKQDLRQVRGRLAGGKISRKRQWPAKQALSKRTQKELQRGREALACPRNNTAEGIKANEALQPGKPLPPIDPHVELPTAVRTAAANAEKYFHVASGR